MSALASLVAAQSGTVTTHVIQVGALNGSLGYFPNNVPASPGDLVQFQFRSNVGFCSQTQLDMV